jgi:orotidine-5'-phosphate decarboxylase
LPPRGSRASRPAPASRRPSSPAPRKGSSLPERFADRLAAAVAERSSQIVLGLDPDPDRVWPEVEAAHAQPAARVEAQCRGLIDAAGSACVAVKLQLACFERVGAGGFEAARAVVDAARAEGLVVLLDAKRGDIPVTAQAYADALYDALGADAVTANPLLGRDALGPLLDRGGTFVLVRTSNPGAAELQDAQLADGDTLSERLAAMVDELGAERVGESGLSDVGAVVGATAPERLNRLRARMPRAPLLLPGIGAQGGRVEDLAPAFAPGRAAGLVTSSRSIVFAHERQGGDPAAAARAEAERLRGAAWALA